MMSGELPNALALSFLARLFGYSVTKCPEINGKQATRNKVTAEGETKNRIRDAANVAIITNRENKTTSLGFTSHFR
jgi:hypothetical protein